ncbi:FAD binding domain-containing protein [bacterium]|nr:FAD binding domain-containing protein [bacterium]MCB2179403.1 FAD binding domain-containing protein [bacterium]
MIIEYLRPKSLEESLKMLSRTTPETVPLGGGTVLNAPSERSVAVVDLQDLGLNGISQKGSALSIGATTTLQALLDTAAVQTALKQALRLEATYNLRQTGTVAGGLVSGGGRSPFLAAMLALDASLVWQPESQEQPLGEFLPLRSGGWLGLLISEVRISTQPQLTFEYIARTPADKPIVLAAAARWPSGRTRIVLAGYGKAPQTILDGEANEGVLEAAEAAYLTAEDAWASAEYRSEMAKVLVGRCLDQMAVTA